MKAKKTDMRNEEATMLTPVTCARLAQVVEGSANTLSTVVNYAIARRVGKYETAINPNAEMAFKATVRNFRTVGYKLTLNGLR